jgi:hypothetical protein
VSPDEFLFEVGESSNLAIALRRSGLAFEGRE